MKQHNQPIVVHYFLLIILMLCCSCTDPYPYKKMQVICVPVYGQSYALGEEAVRVTDFDSLRKKYNHRILTERLDEEFGYFADSELKQTLKRLIHYDRRSFELQCYGMAEEFLNRISNDSILFCTFPGGQGETSITGMMPGSKAYRKFIKEIEQACKNARNRRWSFVLPAYCWMQGENDIVWQTSRDYQHDLLTWHRLFCQDVRRITGQTQDPICICYQSNCLSLSKLPVADTLYQRPEIYVPNDQRFLIRSRKDFMASGPCYPYAVVGERVHIDGTGQKTLGHLAGLTLWRYMQGQNSDGLQPSNMEIKNHEIRLTFQIPAPPLQFDTLQVRNPGNYGFNVISPENKDLIQQVELQNDTVIITCKESPAGCKLRYAVNGVKGKNGHLNGSRGCLRDSQGDTYQCTIRQHPHRLDNWCYQFEILLPTNTSP